MLPSMPSCRQAADAIDDSFNDVGRAVLLVSAAVLAAASLASPALAQQSPAAQRGLTFVRVHCAQCHAIDVVSESPLKIAQEILHVLQSH